jgi:GPH family glycoside/pentoside/hexuronide:cation symporter
MGIFYLFYTIVITPYLALLPEIARTTPERLRLSGWQTVFNMAGVSIAMIVGALLISFVGYHGMAWIFAAVIFISFMMSGLKSKEIPGVDTLPKMGFWAALFLTFKNRPFLIYLFSQVFIWFGFNLIIASIKHICVALLGMHSSGVALCMLLTFAVIIVGIPFVFKLTRNIGKRMTYIYMVAIFIPGFALIYLLHSPWIGVMNLPLGLIIFATLGIPASAFFVIPNTLMGEIIDYDEKLTGRRREAIYFSAQALINKFGLAFSSIFQGFIFTYGYQADNPLGVRLLGPSAAVFVLIGLIFFYFYPLEDEEFRRER